MKGKGTHRMEHCASTSARQEMHLAVYIAYVELANRRRVIERDHIAAGVHQLQINKDISGNSLWCADASKGRTKRSCESGLGVHLYG